MRKALWKKIDIVENPPVWLEDEDCCYYARDYISRGGYGASEANQLITNLKKPTKRKGTLEWPHKIRAIKQFALELSNALKDGVTVTSIPTSKKREDPDYDPRLEMTLGVLAKRRKKIIIEFPIIRRETIQAAHHGGKRNPNMIYKSLQWVGFKKVPEHIVLIDDVITSGSHFKACQRLIMEHHPEISVSGLFWGRTVWPEKQEVA